MAGYVTHNDKPDSVYAMNNLYKNTGTDSDQTTKKYVTDLLNSIDKPIDFSQDPPFIPDAPKATEAPKVPDAL